MRPDLNCTSADTQTGWTGCYNSDGQTGRRKETDTRRKYQAKQTDSQSHRQRDRQVLELSGLVERDSGTETGR